MKRHEKGGHSAKYTVDIKAIAPTKRFQAGTTLGDWDLARATHKSFKALLNEIKHHLHSEGKK